MLGKVIIRIHQPKSSGVKTEFAVKCNFKLEGPIQDFLILEWFIPEKKMLPAHFVHDSHGNGPGRVNGLARPGTVTHQGIGIPVWK